MSAAARGAPPGVNTTRHTVATSAAQNAYACVSPRRRGMSNASMDRVCPLIARSNTRGFGQSTDLARVNGPVGSRDRMASEPDPLQAQYDGIPVPCYTWRREGEDFVLERANQAAFERGDGQL